MLINLCAKYGKPMSIKKKLWAGHESAQTDRQTDRQTDEQKDRRTDRVIPIYPPELHSWGV